jgi:uncharacterized protein DUF4238
VRVGASEKKGRDEVAGRKQHFIPQALQKGFGSAKGKKTQVYVFKKGQEPYLSSTEGVAAQRDFYSEPSEEKSLDDLITTYEGDVLAPAVAALRESPAGRIESHVAAAVVVHLSIRSAFVRGSLSIAATGLLGHFGGAMRSDETARALLGLDSLDGESMLVKSIEEDLLLRFESMPESGRKALAKLAHFRSREKFPQMFPDLAALVLRQFEMLLERMPELVGNSHSRALNQDLVPSARVERLKGMSWDIIEVQSPSHFVLPDCLALGCKTPDFKDMEPYSLLNDDELCGVVMPVSSSKVLVGRIGTPQIDVSSLNRSFAQCSLDFIISSQTDARTAEEAKLIGTTVSRYVDKLLEDEAFTAPGAIAAAPKDGEGRATDPIKVPIKFEPPSRKSGKAQAAVRKLMAIPELQLGLRTVKSIVIADDIAHSLRQRGVGLDDYSAEAVKLGTCSITETSDGVSSELFVTTDAVNHVVKGTSLARPAAMLIRHQTGRATYYATIVAKIPKEVLQRQRPELEGVGLRIANFFSSHYFGGRLSAMGRLSDEEFAATDALYNLTLTRCMQGITNARLHFIEHRDFHGAIRPALFHAEQMLCATASACASTAGEVQRWRESRSIEALRAVSLGDWFELFALDLERFFGSRESMSGNKDLVLLGSHVERVLWSFGILLASPAPDQVWMEVQSDEQLKSTRAMLRV